MDSSDIPAIGRDPDAFEAFYRLQVSPDNQFTFGYQVIVNPTFDTAQAIVGEPHPLLERMSPARLVA